MLHANVVLLTVAGRRTVPYVAGGGAHRRCADLGNGLRRAVLRYGFMERPDVARDLAATGIPMDPEHTSYFLGRSNIVGGDHPLLPRWQRQLFLMLARFATSTGDFFGLPANRVVELGRRIEI